MKQAASRTAATLSRSTSDSIRDNPLQSSMEMTRPPRDLGQREMKGPIVNSR